MTMKDKTIKYFLSSMVLLFLYGCSYSGLDISKEPPTQRERYCATLNHVLRQQLNDSHNSYRGNNYDTHANRQRIESTQMAYDNSCK